MAGSTPNLISINKLSGTRVLIIGGTSGLRFAVARAALEHGASVLVASSRSEKIQSALSRLRTFYPDEQIGLHFDYALIMDVIKKMVTR